MTYIDGFVGAVRTDKKQVYIDNAAKAIEVFKKYGAIQGVENWGVEVPDGKLTSFPMAVKLEEGETVVFSWVVWPSKEAHDAGMEQALKDPFFETEFDMSSVDGKRMIFGSFETILDL